MASLPAIPQFDALTLHRLLRKSSIIRVVAISKIVFVFAILILVILLGSVVLKEYLAVQSDLDSLESRVAGIGASDLEFAATTKSTGDYKAIYQKSIFGDLAPKTAAPSKPQVKKKTKLSLGLIGTFVSGNSSQAIIEDTRKKVQEEFALGEKIFEVATLEKIYRDRIEIRHDGELEILTIDDSATMGAGAASDVDEEFVVDEQELISALDNLPLLLTQARAVPYFKDGKSIGLRLFAIKNGSLYDKVGLKNGDILKSINGQSLGDISQAMKLFERLREDRDVVLELERNRTPRKVRYRIQ